MFHFKIEENICGFNLWNLNTVALKARIYNNHSKSNIEINGAITTNANLYEEDK